MNSQLFDRALKSIPLVEATRFRDNTQSFPKPVKRVKDKSISYASRFRGTWQRPEYDFDEIQIAQDTDSFMSKAIQKKVNKLLSAGFEFVGLSDESVNYVKRRLRQMELATNRPLALLMAELYADMFRFNNHIWAKVRDREASGGDVRKDFKDLDIEPVAGYFPLPFETLEFQRAHNGEAKKIRQRMPNGDTKEWLPRDIVHFYSNKKPGFTVGTPELWPALDDIQLLRRIEENVEELIETNLFPVYHYKVGSDTMPERMTPEGISESEVVRRTIEYMPASGVYISDHRHEIDAVGSEGRALRIDFYLSYFKNRVFAALGTSAVDMGEGTGATKSTASTMSEGMMMDVEAVATIIKAFFDFYVIGELLYEGGYDPTDEENRVEIRFGTINKEERRAHENHLVQTFHGQIRDINEVRKGIGEKPWAEEQYENTYYKMYEEPLALVKSASTPGGAPAATLAELPQSNITPQAKEEQKTFTKQLEKAKKPAGPSGAKPKSSGSGSRSASASRNRPSNQTGTRSTAKTSKDREYFENLLSCEIEDSSFIEWQQDVETRYNELAHLGISFDTVVETMQWRLKD